ncbi:MAG: phasin family protein [Brucellaceae bacterium]|nr:phasin family protein [Brucellaceae bacterium]
MTKKTTQNASAATTYFDQVRDAIENVQGKMEVPAAARDFVKRSATTAKERAEAAHNGALNVTGSAEKLATSFVGGYANVVRGLFDATLANVQHSLDTVEKVAGAKSLNEAIQIQADFVRDNFRANVDRVKGAAEQARTMVADGAKTVQGEFSKVYSTDKAA